MQSCPASSTSIKSPRGNYSATTRPIRQLHQMIRFASSSPSKKSDSAACARRRRSHSVIVIQRLDRLNRKAFQKLFVQHGYFPARETFNSMQAYVHETFCEPNIFCEPSQTKSIYICSPQRIRLRTTEPEKQSITGNGTMSSIRPSYLRSTLTERFNGSKGTIASQDANTLPVRPHRR
jgi:hypothetical protein